MSAPAAATGVPDYVLKKEDDWARVTHLCCADPTTWC
jgi:hypothetical protein